MRILSIVVLLSFTACEGIRTIEIPTEKEITVPGAGIGAQNPLVPEDVFPVDFGELLSDELNQSLSTEGVNTGAIESMKLTTLSVTVLDPEENGNVVRDLSFLNSMRFVIKASADDDDEGIEVASSADGAFDERITNYDFELSGAELGPTVKTAQDLTMGTDVDIARTPSFATTIVFSSVMTVVIDPLGAL